MPSLEEIYDVLRGKVKLDYDYTSFSNEGMYKAFIGLIDRIKEGVCTPFMLKEYVVVTCPQKEKSYVIGVDNGKIFVLKPRAMISSNSTDELVRRTLGFDKFIGELNYSLPSGFDRLRVRVQGEIVFQFKAYKDEEEMLHDIAVSTKEKIEEVAIKKATHILSIMLDNRIEVVDNKSLALQSFNKEDLKFIEMLLNNTVKKVVDEGVRKVVVFDSPLVNVNVSDVLEAIKRVMKPEGVEVKYGSHSIYLYSVFPLKVKTRINVFVGQIPVKVYLPSLEIQDDFDLFNRDVITRVNLTLWEDSYYLPAGQYVTVSHPEHGEVKIKVDKPIKLRIREIEAERELHYVTFDVQRMGRIHHFIDV